MHRVDLRDIPVIISAEAAARRWPLNGTTYHKNGLDFYADPQGHALAYDYKTSRYVTETLPKEESANVSY